MKSIEGKNPRLKWLGSTLVIAALISGVICFSPGLRSDVSAVSIGIAPGNVYDGERSSINRVLKGSGYSVLHVPSGGVAVILNVSQADAAQISDPTVNLSPPSPYYIDADASGYSSGDTDDFGLGLAQLKDCYKLTIPKSMVAAVVIDTDISTKDTLNAVLHGLNLRRIGPGVDPGTYVLLDNDHHLVKYLHSVSVICGTMQTTNDDDHCDPAPTPNCSPEGTIMIPLEKYRVMDVTCGVVH